MKRINFTFTAEELTLLVSLASDQLFRRQFIDPRMPGYKAKPEELALGKDLVGRMKLVVDEGARHGTPVLTRTMPLKAGGVI